MAEKRLRTAYILRRRYRLLGRVLGVAGGLIALAVVGMALARAQVDGEPVPPASWAIGLLIVAVSAVVPWALVRWRWRRLRFWLSLDHD